jgi:hypothetical protein
MAALFITMTFLGTTNSSGVQPIIAIERPVFYRERAAGGWQHGPGLLGFIVRERSLVWERSLHNQEASTVLCWA